MYKNKWTFDKAWEYGRSKRGKMYPNSGFQKQLRLFELEVTGFDQLDSKDMDIYSEKMKVI